MTRPEPGPAVASGVHRSDKSSAEESCIEHCGVLGPAS